VQLQSIRRHMYANERAHTHSLMRHTHGMCAHAYIYTRAHAHTHMRAHARANSHTHARAHTYTYTRIYTYTHTSQCACLCVHSPRSRCTLIRTLNMHAPAAACKPIDAANVLWALGAVRRQPPASAMEALLDGVCEGPCPLNQQVGRRAWAHVCVCNL